MNFINRISIVCMMMILIFSSGMTNAENGVTSANSDDDKILTIGSKAPAIDVEHWVQDGDGQFSKVTKFKDGNVYVVEFWATWCGPCVAAMPHISELQKKYADKGVQIISISDEDLETVENFLERQVRGEEMTYQELTKNYCLTTDPDRSCHVDFMKAAGQGGIPTAFIVGKDGHVEWIGHPMTIDKPLAQIVSDKWDREKFGIKFRKSQKLEIARGKIMRSLRSDPEEAIEMIDDLAKDLDGSELLQLKQMKMAAMMSIGKEAEVIKMLKREMKSGIEDEKGVFATMMFQLLQRKGVEALEPEFDNIAKAAKGDTMALNQISWAIVEMADAGDEVPKGLISSARKAAERAVEIEPENGAILDTLAHLVHMQGDLDEAIKIQEKAVKFADAQSAGEVKAYMEELMKEKEKNK